MSTCPTHASAVDSLLRTAVVLMDASWVVAVCATLGLLFVLHSLMLVGESIIADEGGVTHMVLSRMYSGFNLWLTSILIAAGGSLWWWLTAHQQRFLKF